MSYKNSQQNVNKKEIKISGAINIKVKHNQHQLLSIHLIHSESEGGPSDKKNKFSSNFSIRNVKTISF